MSGSSPNVPDAVGSHGVAVAVASQEWIFSSTPMQMIGERDIDPATGAVTGTTAILRRAIVDRLGEVPAWHVRLSAKADGQGQGQGQG